MPCSGCGDDYRDDEVRIEYRDNPKFQKEIDNLTQMLCYLCGMVTKKLSYLESQLFFEKDLNLLMWWERHQHTDEKRLVAEMLKYLNDECIGIEYLVGIKQDIIKYFIEKAEKEHPVSDWHKEYFFNMCFEKAKEEYSISPLLLQIKGKITNEEFNALKELIKDK